MITATQEALTSLITVIKRCGGAYTEPCDALSNATIGQHTRHIIEFYHCLLEGYEKGCFSYDNRRRETQIETDAAYAEALMYRIINELDKPNKSLCFTYLLRGENHEVLTSYEREIIYSLDHCIHHQALIRVAVLSLTGNQLPESFGVAPATMAYRERRASIPMSEKKTLFS